MSFGSAVDEQQAVSRREGNDVGARAGREREVEPEVGQSQRTGRGLRAREARPARREQPRGRADQSLPACKRCLHIPIRDSPSPYPHKDTQTTLSPEPFRAGAELQFSAVEALRQRGSIDTLVQTTSVATTTRGFILQATYRVTGPDERRAPVVYLYGRLEDGSTFRVRDDRRRPCFYIRSTDAEAVVRIGAPTPAPTDRTTFGGSPVARIEVAAPSDVPALRDRLHAAGIDTFEADVRFASRYLIERGIKAGCEITGVATPGERIAW